MRKIALFIVTLLSATAMAQTVKSPNGNVSLTFALDNGIPTYQLSYKGKDVVRPSRLGLELAKDKHANKGYNETDLMDGFSVANTQTCTFDETWKPVWGETATIRNHYNELAVDLLQDATKRHITIRFRVYDDGMGLRYEFPQQQELNYFLIKDEHTEFAMAGDHIAWWLPGDYDTQEQETQQTRLSEIRERMGQAVNWGLERAAGEWIAIVEPDDFIDARTFQRDKDMHIIVDFQLTDTLLGMIDEGVTDLHETQIVIGPARANGWSKFGQYPEGIICDYPQHNLATDDSEWVKKGENLVSPDDENVWCPLFVKNDGFIKITDPSITQIEFTLPAAEINQLIDNYSDPEKGFDGILFQMGGSCQITKVTIDQGNVFLASQLAEAGF